MQHYAPVGNPSAPPPPPAYETLEAALGQCVQCKRLDWTENMTQTGNGEFFCSDLSCQAPRRRRCCCTIS
jgi:hypothetical protein